MEVICVIYVQFLDFGYWSYKYGADCSHLTKYYSSFLTQVCCVTFLSNPR